MMDNKYFVTDTTKSRAFFLVAFLGILSAAPAFGQVHERTRGMDARDMMAWVDAQDRQSFIRMRDQDCSGYTNRRDAIMNGNKITTQVFNFGSISAPGNAITDIVWNGLGYGYEFSPFVAARVPVADAVTGAVHDTVIVSDGLIDGGEVSDTGDEFWGWQPIPCAQPVGSFEGLRVVNPNSSKIPTSDAVDQNRDGKPASWPEDWYNQTLGRYVWPGAIRQGESAADKETLYFMNDYQNSEFRYYPFPADSSQRGLGLEVETRLYQWSNALAEDILFLVYKITNKSEKDLDEVIFGMWGDPHVGGADDYSDDLASFDKSINMVYTWDDDGRSSIAGIEPGYFGYKFLESPGIGRGCIGGHASNRSDCEAQGGRIVPGDGIDNDGDGMVDESWTDGIDNDGDWDPVTDDVGVDGIPGTGDEGEGDGVPTAGSQYDITRPGEPNFEFTDIDESDQIGLTSFSSPLYGSEEIQDDAGTWDLIQPGVFENVPETPGDYLFIYGAGKFTLRAGATKRFSIALIVGENRQDLTLNAVTAQQIYDSGYQFAKPPAKPVVRAVPGDEQVTLYWDDRAEASVDPLTGENDFEGYVIYRSTDPSFSDQQTITDVNSAAFLYEPLETVNGADARFDLDNGISGLSSIPYRGRGVSYDLGDDTGLRHSFVDSNNVVNGQRYFYAVVAYDHGSTQSIGGFENGIPPAETSKIITYNPTTDEYFFNDNTVSVIPGPRVAGYVPPSIAGEIRHVSGPGTGEIRLTIIDETAVRPDNEYRIIFETTESGTVYSIINENPLQVTFAAVPDKFTPLGVRNVVASSFQLTTQSGRQLSEGSGYELNADVGVVKPLSDAGISPGDSLTATFTYMPIYENPYLTFDESETNNLVFDGLRASVSDDELSVDFEETGWVGGGSYDTARVATAGPGQIAQPYDYEIRFTDDNVTTSLANDHPLPFRIFNVTRANQQIQAFTPDDNQNDQWDASDPIVFVETFDGEETATWEVTLAEEGEAGPLPSSGDVFLLKTSKPFSDADAFVFETQAAMTTPEETASDLDNVYVVPNPYVAFSSFEPNNPVSRTERGQRRLYFANVPKTCTIRIYTLAGELVDTIHHNSTLDNGKAFWNLRTHDNMNIAYGLYFFHLESPAGTTMGKFAVIK